MSSIFIRIIFGREITEDDEQPVYTKTADMTNRLNNSLLSEIGFRLIIQYLRFEEKIFTGPINPAVKDFL